MIATLLLGDIRRPPAGESFGILPTELGRVTGLSCPRQERTRDTGLYYVCPGDPAPLMHTESPDQYHRRVTADRAQRICQAKAPTVPVVAQSAPTRSAVRSPSCKCGSACAPVSMTAELATHEAGHLMLAHLLGGEAHGAYRFRCGAFSDVELPLDPVHAAATLWGGELAAELLRLDSPMSEGDFDCMTSALRGLEARDRAAAMGRGKRLARETLRARRDDLRWLAIILKDRAEVSGAELAKHLPAR